ncbi:MAG: DUF4149 domain-containing protein [Gammaproteobacteria bacterium]|nr:DUF4149 domain-containing protein [Gammaproteobacteria bacterium]
MSLNKLSSHFLNQTSGEKILLTFWVGSLWAIGYLAVPTLFATLENRQLAGMLAGKMFTAVSYVGVFCALMLLLSTAKRSIQIKTDKQIWLLILMLLLVIIGEFILQPQMAELKQSVLVDGSEVAQQFDRLHHIATSLYMINSLLGLALVVFHSKQKL